MFLRKEKYRLFADERKMEGLSAEEIIPILRAYGANLPDSVYAIKIAFDLSLREADQLVIYSPTWEDNLHGTLAIREAFADTLGNLEAIEAELAAEDALSNDSSPEK